MRITLVHGGAAWATHDVHTGLLAGLRAGGHEVEEYALGARLVEARVTLEYRWRKHVRNDGPLKDVRPTAADVQYAAGMGLLERALRFEPDWVVVVAAAYLHPDVAILARRAGLKLAVVFTESPYDDPEQAKVAPLFDVCFTNERRSVEALAPANRRTFYLPAGYDPATHGPGAWWISPHSGKVPDHDVVFVGTGFESRTELLSCVDWTGIDLGLYGQWAPLPAGHPLLPHVREGLVDNARAGALYRAAKVGLNLYRGTGGAPAESMNPRAYELAADGVCAVAQPRLEQAERLGDAVVPADGAAPLEEAIRALLADPQRRRRRQEDAPARVQHDTYHHRAEALVARLT